MLHRRLPLSAWDDYTVGMLINYANGYDRMQKRINGEKVSDSEEQYRQLKAMQPQVEEMYRNGEIKKYKYESFMRSLTAYESEMI